MVATAFASMKVSKADDPTGNNSAPNPPIQMYAEEKMEKDLMKEEAKKVVYLGKYLGISFGSLEMQRLRKIIDFEARDHGDKWRQWQRQDPQGFLQG